MPLLHEHPRGHADLRPRRGTRELYPRRREFGATKSDSLRHRRGTPQSLADLTQHDLIHYMSTLGAKSEGFEYPGPGGYRTLPMSGPVVVNNSDAYNAACLAGLGLIQAPEIGVREHLARGALIEVLPNYRPEPMSLSLLYAHRRNLPTRVRVFMDWVAETLRPILAH